MATLSQMTGQGRTIEVGGKEYNMRPITMGLLGELQDHYEMMPLRKAKAEIELLGVVITEDDRAGILDRARKEVLRFRNVRQRHEYDEDVIEAEGKKFDEWMSSMDGTGQIMFSRLKHNGLSREDVDGLIDLTGLAEIQEILDVASFGAADPDDKEKDDGVKKNSATNGLCGIGHRLLSPFRRCLAFLLRSLRSCLSFNTGSSQRGAATDR